MNKVQKKKIERTKSMLGIAMEALEKISHATNCFGPGCSYCDSDMQHPLTHEASIAIVALAAIKRKKENA